MVPYRGLEDPPQSQVPAATILAPRVSKLKHLVSLNASCQEERAGEMGKDCYDRQSHIRYRWLDRGDIFWAQAEMI